MLQISQKLEADKFNIEKLFLSSQGKSSYIRAKYVWISDIAKPVWIVAFRQGAFNLEEKQHRKQERRVKSWIGEAKSPFPALINQNFPRFVLSEIHFLQKIWQECETRAAVKTRPRSYLFH